MSSADNRIRVAVIGAGISGLASARAMLDQGHRVTVLEKARGPGGRMSTRRKSGFSFDHGAQYFTTSHSSFERQVRAWRSAGLARAWTGRVGTLDEHGQVTPRTGDRWVGIPGMSGICRGIAEGLPDCRYGWHTDSLHWNGDSWRLQSRTGDRLEADALVISTPPAQALALLSGSGVTVDLPDTGMASCWAVMAVFDQPLLPHWDGLIMPSGPLSWVASQASKPGRASKQAWVLHAHPDWSAEHVEASREDVCEALLTAAARLPGAQRVNAEYIEAHRWRYAMPSAPVSSGPLKFSQYRLVVTGDWCLGSRVEDAWLSGQMAAGGMSALLDRD